MLIIFGPKGIITTSIKKMSWTSCMFLKRITRKALHFIIQKLVTIFNCNVLPLYFYMK